MSSCAERVLVRCTLSALQRRYELVWLELLASIVTRHFLSSELERIFTVSVPSSSWSMLAEVATHFSSYVVFGVGNTIWILPDPNFGLCSNCDRRIVILVSSMSQTESPLSSFTGDQRGSTRQPSGRRNNYFYVPLLRLRSQVLDKKLD